MKLRLRKVWRFTGPDESYWGDCAKWAAAVMRDRPDLTMSVSTEMTNRSIRCTCCSEGLRH